MNKSKIIEMVKKNQYADALDVIMEMLDSSKKILMPSDILGHLKKYSSKTQEYFIAITLNGAHDVINVNEITKGLVNKTLVHPREIFRACIMDNSAAVILSHNHPSGSPEPSIEDIDLTDKIKQAGEIIGIPVLDHIIISRNKSYSFKEHGTCNL